MAQEVSFFSRIGRGWTIAMAGWGFIWNNPSSLLFPLFSAIAQALVFIPFTTTVVIYVVQKKVHNPHLDVHAQPTLPPSFYAIYACLLLLTAFISSIMYTALSHYMAQRLQNKPSSLFASLGRALSRFKTLLLWSLLNITLTLIFNWIRNAAKDDKFPFNLIANLVAGMLQFAWKFLTFFVYPIFALTDLGVIASIKESGKTVKKMWGEQIGASFSISFVGLIAFLILAAVVWPLGFFALGGIKTLVGATEAHVADALTMITICALPIIVIGLWLGTARTLFQTVAYMHTQGKSVGPFDNNFIQTSFAQKSH